MEWETVEQAEAAYEERVRRLAECYCRNPAQVADCDPYSIHQVKAVDCRGCLPCQARAEVAGWEARTISTPTSGGNGLPDNRPTPQA